jgi:hypothetical protein
MEESAQRMRERLQRTRAGDGQKKLEKRGKNLPR